MILFVAICVFKFKFNFKVVSIASHTKIGHSTNKRGQEQKVHIEKNAFVSNLVKLTKHHNIGEVYHKRQNTWTMEYKIIYHTEYA